MPIVTAPTASHDAIRTTGHARADIRHVARSGWVATSEATIAVARMATITPSDSAIGIL